MAEQELPPCPRHPDKLCPGECQYILPPYACWWDKEPDDPGEASDG